MKMLPLLLLGCAALASRGETLAERYAAFGELIVTQFASAPFPHPKRAEGHTYQTKLYPATEHYSDSTVAIFIPKGFRETGKIDFVVHFHGWQNNVEGCLGALQADRAIRAHSGRNAVLVVPQGPRNAPDSFGGKLEDPDGFKRFMDEVVETLRQQSALKKKDFTLGQIVLSGHSGGYEVISAILDRGGLTDHVREVWLFDALYAQTDKFLSWIEPAPGGCSTSTPNTAAPRRETEQLMARLKQRGTSVLRRQGERSEAGRPRTEQAGVSSSPTSPHNDVLDKHQEFQRFPRDELP